MQLDLINGPYSETGTKKLDLVYPLKRGVAHYSI